MSNSIKIPMHQAEYPDSAHCRTQLLKSLKRANESYALRRSEMEIILGGLAFGGLIAAQFLAVAAVHKARWESGSSEHEPCTDARTRHIWRFGS
jgi:hypothetical protein